MKVPRYRELGLLLRDMDPPDRVITAEELRTNCGYRTKAEAAESPHQEPTGITYKIYTWRERVLNLERLYDKLRGVTRSEQEIYESTDFHLELMRKQGVNVDEV